MKFTTLSQHIGDGNHMYEVGETREVDEPGTVQHLVNDKVLGDFDEAAEQAFKDAAEAKAKAEPVTKVDADKSVASVSTVNIPDQASFDALTKERDDAVTTANGMTGERDSARADLDAARKEVDALTKERDALKTELAAAKATHARGKNA